MQEWKVTDTDMAYSCHAIKNIVQEVFLGSVLSNQDLKKTKLDGPLIIFH